MTGNDPTFSQQTFLWQHFEDLLSIWGESPVVPTLFTLRRKRKTPDWLSSYNTTGLADLCADFDANEVDKVDFESESSCWSDSSTDDSDEDESGDDNLGLDFFPIFNVSFYFKSQYVCCIIDKCMTVISLFSKFNFLHFHTRHVGIWAMVHLLFDHRKQQR